jgi:YhcH/YjgK/YiaL family protein
MIIDKLDNWTRYPLGAAWRKAFNFVNAQASLPREPEDGEQELRGRQLFARIMTYLSKKPADAVLEAHRSYVDLQVVLSGAELVEWYPLDGLQVDTPYDAAKDAEFYRPPSESMVRVVLRPGMFVALLPRDAHLTQVMAGRIPERVKKIVVKIAADLIKSA